MLLVLFGKQDGGGIKDKDIKVMVNTAGVVKGENKLP